MAKYYFGSKEKAAFLKEAAPFGVKELTPWQFRVAGVLDFYPTTGKLVLLRRGETVRFIPGKVAEACQKYLTAKPKKEKREKHNEACVCDVCKPLVLPEGYVPQPVILRPAPIRKPFVPPRKWTTKDIKEWNERRLSV